MAELDLAAAVDAGARALWADTGADELAWPSWDEADPDDRARCRELARAAVEAAAPLIEAAVRERLAGQILALYAPERFLNKEWAHVFRHGVTMAAAIARGEEPSRG